jgi:hypothetical protein
LQFLTRVGSLLLRNQTNLILEDFIKCRGFIVRIDLKQNVGDIFIDVILDGLDSSWMFDDKVTQVKYLILIEDIALAVFLTLSDPFVDGFSLHLK